MCKASIDALRVRNAKEGDQTAIYFSRHGFPQFMRGKDCQEGVVTCAKFGQTMRISNIPPEAQEMLRTDDTIIATFIEDACDLPDKILLEDDRLIDLLDVVWSRRYEGEVVVEMRTILGEDDWQRILSEIAGRMQPKFRYKRHASSTVVMA